MELTIEIPEKLIKRAEELGLPVKTLVDQALQQIADAPRFGEAVCGDEPIPAGFVRLGVPTMTREEATASIREIQKNHTLGGLNIKELINEGRRT
jgi:hypothetical protein